MVQEFTQGGQAEAARCGTRAALERAGCPPGAVVEPRGRVRVLQDVVLGDGGGAQLGPRSLRVSLRPGEERSFQVRFRRARGHPVDLYYLMDLSYSMKDDLENVRKLGSDLLAALRNVTSSVRIGFGSFVDKTVLPYVSTVPSKLRNPCPARHERCAPPAAFRHVLSLTADASEFASRVSQQRISGNLDSPEGGFDAIMQVALCEPSKRALARARRGRGAGGGGGRPGPGAHARAPRRAQEQIGWRPVTRLLVFASDDTFHTAGDGKLGGIVAPSDSRCHLDASGVYSKSHLYVRAGEGGAGEGGGAARTPGPPLPAPPTPLQDYPSVGHLAQVLSAANIQPIFAVTGPTVPVYQELSRLIPKSVVGELREDSSNVVQLISDAYDSLSSTVELQHSPLPPGVSLGYEPHCGGPPGPPRPHGGVCSGVRVGQQVNFTVRVRAGGCLAAPQAVVLRVLGFAEELRLELRSLCGCPCAPAPTPAPLCHGGTLECGVCRCPAGQQGRRCECEGPAAGGDCRPPNGTGPPCGGRGRCVCGRCQCPPGLSGPQCQCDSSACERHDGLPCGGPRRGECVCGRCRCRAGFAGSACGCGLEPGACLRGRPRTPCQRHR
ncbi:integrin beta-7 [Rhea pennata]|uniref:integrin beta-7 n=1 Tax=Rhea pennata TaxID=8795 RepID=UPI002E262B28